MLSDKKNGDFREIVEIKDTGGSKSKSSLRYLRFREGKYCEKWVDYVLRVNYNEKMDCSSAECMEMCISGRGRKWREDGKGMKDFSWQV